LQCRGSIINFISFPNLHRVRTAKLKNVKKDNLIFFLFLLQKYDGEHISNLYMA